MSTQFPLTINNPVGERITFLREESNDRQTQVVLEASCKPGSGPTMHTHLLQDEELTVISGKMAYETINQGVKYAEVGETILFKRGTPHKFWADGDKELFLAGRITPAHNVVFFLKTLYEAQNKSGKGQPEQFDGAFLLARYKNEYDMPEIPGFVKSVILPLTYRIGKVLGKYAHLKDAPKPL